MLSLRVPGESASFARVTEILSSGEEFVHVRLVAGVEDDGVFGRVEDSVHGDGEFNNTEVRPEVSTRFADRSDQKRAHFVSELLHLPLGERFQISRPVDRSQQRVGGSGRVWLLRHS